MSPDKITDRLAAAARELHHQIDPHATVKSALELVVQNVENCDSVGISIVRGRRQVTSFAASDETAATADRLQHDIGEGPCLDAVWRNEVVYVPDLGSASDWQAWSAQMCELTPARSLLSLRLFTLAETLGALNMYSTKPDGFTAEDRDEALGLAAHIALAVAAAQKTAQLEAALDSRTVIAQACGLVMERFDIDAVMAFALLTRLSSTQNVKLREVATELVRTRLLPTSGT